MPKLCEAWATWDVGFCGWEVNRAGRTELMSNVTECNRDMSVVRERTRLVTPSDFFQRTSWRKTIIIYEIITVCNSSSFLITEPN